LLVGQQLLKQRQRLFVLFMGLREQAMKKFQRGFGAPDLGAAFLALGVICIAIGVVLGFAMTIGIPWIWEKAKPFIHQITA
jgi:hypothetical protein